MPVATTPTNTAMSLAESTLRRMTISGKREADDGHHEGEHGAQGRALLEQGLDDGDDAGGVGVHGHAQQTATGTDHQAPLPMMEAMKFSGT